MNANQQIAEQVLEMLANAKAHKPSGTNDGELSISDVVARLRERGWKNIRTNGFSGAIDDILKQQGFSIIERKAGRAYRRFVTL